MDNTEKEIAVLEDLEKMSSVPSVAADNARLSSSPVQDVEKSLGSFTRHTFDIIKEEYDFQRCIEEDIKKRLQLDPKEGGFTAKEVIALLTNNSVNLNDRISKVLGPTFQLMTEEVKAEINARNNLEREKQSQVNIAIGGSAPEDIKRLNETVGSNKDEAQAIMQGMFQMMNLMSQMGVKTSAEQLADSQQKQNITN